MKLSQQSLSALRSAIQKATDSYAHESDSAAIVTDIHLQPLQTSGALFILNDDDEELAHTTVEEWRTYEDDDFYNDVKNIFKDLLNKMNEEKCFGQVRILKPYSFVLVDEEKETFAELLLIDDDTLMLDDELLKGLDEELDVFLKKLLEE